MKSSIPGVHIEGLLVKCLARNHFKLLGAAKLLSRESHKLKLKGYILNCFFEAAIIKKKSVFIVTDIGAPICSLNLVKGCGTPVAVYHTVDGSIATFNHYFSIY